MALFQEIKTRQEEFMQGFNAGDAHRASQVYDKDGYFMPNGHSPVKGREGIEKYFKQDMADGVVSAQIITEEVNGSGDWAFERGSYHLDGKRGTESGAYLQIWRKIDGVWFIHNDCFNIVKTALKMAEEVSSFKKFLYELQTDWGTGDLYRDTPIRYLGYANETGEAFRAWVPLSVVRSTYVVAFGYVIADTLDKTHKVYKKPFENIADRSKQMGLTFLDTLGWQTFASVLIPGFTINRVVAASTYGLKKLTKLGPTSVKLFSTSMGLATIPFIVRPIDALVEVGMDHTLRKLYKVDKPYLS
ncbi:unnamed protein product [Bursaphelenchus okinawaensis]|uniref:Mitochondrial fission process protein 1 n=1 Tax=Bursaphelenchus okinawaensis TaxID=465554 RepID=A0A811LML3_9BILA|nr:unnamed protein product [Bursaphelenchus okinawaensis]CAG9128129.1 unnamed protein product [Bursaphelenchus okinawaensis]